MNPMQPPNTGAGGRDFGERKVKNIRVRVENIETGEIEKDFDCGTDQRRADKLEDSLLDRTNLDKYHVYQSVSV